MNKRQKILRNIHKLFNPKQYKQNNNIKPLFNLNKGDTVYALYTPNMEQISLSDSLSSLDHFFIIPCKVKLMLVCNHNGKKVFKLRLVLTPSKDKPTFLRRYCICSLHTNHGNFYPLIEYNGQYSLEFNILVNKTCKSIVLDNKYNHSCKIILTTDKNVIHAHIKCLIKNTIKPRLIDRLKYAETTCDKNKYVMLIKNFKQQCNRLTWEFYQKVK